MWEGGGMDARDVLTFVLCRRVVSGPEGTVTLEHLLPQAGYKTLPGSARIEVYFEAFLGTGSVEIVTDAIDEFGVAVCQPQRDIIESVSDAKPRMGIVRLGLEFVRPGWHNVRLRIGTLVLERPLWVWTPETREPPARPRPAP